MKKLIFTLKKKFYQNIDISFVASCPRHPHFKERIGSRFTNITCTQLIWGRYNNCKLICFNINFLTDKIKVESYFDIHSTIETKPIEQYLMMDIKSMLFFYFCCGCFKVQCSLDNPCSISLIKKNFLVFACDFCLWIFKNMYNILMCSCNRYRLNQQNIDYAYSYLFDDFKCFENHVNFVVECQMCLYYLVGFMISYFSSMCFGCVYLKK